MIKIQILGNLYIDSDDYPLDRDEEARAWFYTEVLGGVLGVHSAAVGNEVGFMRVEQSGPPEVLEE